MASGPGGGGGGGGVGGSAASIGVGSQPDVLSPEGPFVREASQALLGRRRGTFLQELLLYLHLP